MLNHFGSGNAKCYICGWNKNLCQCKEVDIKTEKVDMIELINNINLDLDEKLKQEKLKQEIINVLRMYFGENHNCKSDTFSYIDMCANKILEVMGEKR